MLRLPAARPDAKPLKNLAISPFPEAACRAGKKNGGHNEPPRFS
ncbi:hypothetical protein [Azospirillum argentinense]